MRALIQSREKTSGLSEKNKKKQMACLSNWNEDSKMLSRHVPTDADVRMRALSL